MSVKVRLTGSADDVKLIAEVLREVLDVGSESKDYPNREDEGVRRYLEVSLPEGDDER